MDRRVEDSLACSGVVVGIFSRHGTLLFDRFVEQINRLERQYKTAV